MTKITILNNSRKTETLRLTDVPTLAENIRTRVYEQEVNELRTFFPLLTLKRKDDGSLEGAFNYTRKIPRVCFASALENRNNRRVNKGYTGLVLLEVDNLQSYEEADAIRQGAGRMPQTLLAFVGVSGRSVKIVCQGELFGDSKNQRNDDDRLELKLPQTEEDIRQFHLSLYEKARMAYNAQLGVTIEKLEPHLERTCYVSTDAYAVYNPTAIPFYIDLLAPTVTVPTTIEPRESAPGLDRYLSLHKIYEFNLSKAFDDVRGCDSEEDSETFVHLLAGRLADHCRETGIPMGIALRMTDYRWPFRAHQQLVRLVFDNAYKTENERRQRSRKGIVKPTKNVPPETLMTMKIDIFLRENYELRKNVMRGVAEYRQRTGLGFDFQDLTDQARNSITLRALEQGIRCWDKDIRRFICSDDIEPYDPICDFLEHLPRWDGTDRVRPLALRVPTSYEQWPHLFHIWMRSMVAMWQGKGQLTGNALVPLLVGRQGCGKTSFWRILLPREQREYYNDRINFKNEQDLNLGLTSFALINLDEFDKITQRQQIVLKYLVSTSDLKYRPPYGKAYQSHRRYASFVSTTNEPTPLTDPTGNRRFVCVTVEGNIDFRTPVEYPQLYAQLKQEIADGERYWLTKDEEQALMEHNVQYQQVNGLGEMLLSLYRKPESAATASPSDDCEASWVPLRDTSARLKAAFGSSYTGDPSAIRKLGNFMNRPEYKFESRRRSGGMEYWVEEIMK